MKQFNFTKTSGGFTIVETLVAIGIILILSTILVPNYKVFQEEFSLLRSAHKLSQDLRRAQEMATSAKELPGQLPKGYGIYLRKGDTYYRLYADLDGDQEYDSGEEIELPIALENKVKIEEVSPSPLSINFKGPDPVTKILGDADSVTITLALETNPAKTQEVFVNKVGLIYVK